MPGANSARRDGASGAIQIYIDRLLVSALIELRSCERFSLLARYCRGRDAVLARFYERLCSSERGHYHVFLKLAGLTLPRAQVHDRWQEFLQIEPNIIQAQAPGPRIHSGLPG